MTRAQTSKRPGAKKPEDLLGRFRADFSLYARTCLKIETKQEGLQPFKPNRVQQIIHDKLTRQLEETGKVRAIILKARQPGVSTYVAGRFFRRTSLSRNLKALVIAHEIAPAQKLFNIYDRYYRHLPLHLKPQTRSAKLGNTLWFDNIDPPGLDSQISVATANNKDAARGSTYQLVHASELAFWEKPEDTWLALGQSVPKKSGEIIIESTPNGVGNFFHDRWRAAREGNSEYIPIFLPWWIHGEYELPITDEQRDTIDSSLDEFEAKALTEGIELEGIHHKLTYEQLWWRRMAIRDECAGDERKFLQEYPSDDRECFLVSGSCFFDQDALQEYEDAAKRPKLRGNIISEGPTVRVSPDERGYLRIWHPPEKGIGYVIGADTAEGKASGSRDDSISEADTERGGRDYSCAYVYDIANQRFVAQLHGRMAPEVFAQMLHHLGYFYANGMPALLAVEANHSSGETALRKLKEEHKYPNLYYSRQMNVRRNKITPKLGWVTTVVTRMPMLDELSQFIRERAVGLPCKDTVRECFTFVRDDTGKPQAAEGCHDDRVIAAAVALQMHHHVDLRPKGEIKPALVRNTPTGY